MLMTGRILRFDEVRGYGFIVPSGGGEDVFMHARDLLDEEHLYQAGRDVEFFMEMGDKGPKASEIRLVHQDSSHRLTGESGPNGSRRAEPAAAGPVSVPAPRQVPEVREAEDELCEVLSAGELRSELTEALIEADGTLTADQIKRARARLIELAHAHGWVAS
ncbi:cold shock domain-containing protein [Streptomyces sp. ACA25]|uniref:cold shock domain-containing protein n=1 Tax=Streptomyces sp. ACA25 TaxID=3022596 RepID=UPI002307B43F|nr:cold shock domain-containing protein [Streptomyces sp. ACA25]MDB1090330.1 cold shock domain-containing protein [Streptomyces sp. ACA25]